MRERPTNRIDLHVHSTASDGKLSPSEVVSLALRRGLRLLALTDHDTLEGVAEAQRAAYGTRLEVIAGVEINAENKGGTLHILGYYVDLENALLQEWLQAMREARAHRARQTVERLREMGMALEMEEVEWLAGGNSIGRPHLARALLSQGYVATLQEAFRFLAPGGPAYVPRPRLEPAEAIRAILGAGGLPVLAHPAHSGAAALSRIAELVSYGLRGLEVYYPRHSPAEVRMLRALCRTYGLLATGGTDFHGPGADEGAPLGSVYVPWACADRLRASVMISAGRASALRG